jgi:hypothetical protein
MAGILLLILIGGSFYVLIGFGPEALVKVFIALCWVVLALSIPVSLIVSALR